MAPSQTSLRFSQVRSLFTKKTKAIEASSAQRPSSPLGPPPLYSLVASPKSTIRSIETSKTLSQRAIYVQLDQFTQFCQRPQYLDLLEISLTPHFHLVQNFLQQSLLFEYDDDHTQILTEEQAKYFTYLGCLADKVQYHVKQYGCASLAEDLFEEVRKCLDLHFKEPVRLAKVDDELALNMLLSFKERWNRENRGVKSGGPITYTNDWYLKCGYLEDMRAKLEREKNMVRMLFLISRLKRNFLTAIEDAEKGL